QGSRSHTRLLGDQDYRDDPWRNRRRSVSMTLNWGYALSSTMFVGIFAAAVAAQIAATRFHPLLYWVVIVATTTAGTTMADFADRRWVLDIPGDCWSCWPA